MVDAGLWVCLDSGVITGVEVDLEKRSVVLRVEERLEGIEIIKVERALVNYSVTESIVGSQMKLTKNVKDGKYGDEVDFKGGKAGLTFAW